MVSGHLGRRGRPEGGGLYPLYIPLISPPYLPYVSVDEDGRKEVDGLLPHTLSHTLRLPLSLTSTRTPYPNPLTPTPNQVDGLLRELDSQIPHKDSVYEYCV